MWYSKFYSKKLFKKVIHKKGRKILFRSFIQNVGNFSTSIYFQKTDLKNFSNKADWIPLVVKFFKFSLWFVLFATRNYFVCEHHSCWSEFAVAQFSTLHQHYIYLQLS